MALPATAVWEIRSTATATNSNGGGYNPQRNPGNSVDYSQQDSAQYSFTDLTSVNGNTASPIVISSSHSFTVLDEGNFIRINAGTSWTQDWYEIVSTNAGSATLDKACGTVATLSAGTYSLGGALSLGSTTANRTDSNWATKVIAGNTIWIKSGTYNIGGTQTFAAGTAASQTKLMGYVSTRGDDASGNNRPLWTFNNASLSPGARNQIMNLRLQGSGSGGFFLSITGFCILKNVKVTNLETSANSSAINVGGANCSLLDCDISSARGNAITIASSATSIYIDGCYIHDSLIGISDASTNGMTTITNSIIASNINIGVSYTSAKVGSAQIFRNTFYGAENKQGDGIDIVLGANGIIAQNNTFSGFVTAINDLDSNTNNTSDFNNYFNNTSNLVGRTSGPNDMLLNPQFLNMTQLTGSTATTSSTTLTQIGADFSSVVDGQDYLHIKSGTGAQSGLFLIISHTITSVTVDLSIGTSAIADKVWQITTGKNFGIGINLKAKATPSAISSAGSTINYQDLGAIQRQELAPTKISTYVGG